MKLWGVWSCVAIPPIIYERAEQQYNLDQLLFRMSLSTRILLFAVLVGLLTSQSVPVATGTYYTVQNQTYQYVYGSGSQGANSLGNRTDTTAPTTTTASSVSTSTGPTPVQITCPYNQVYDNILCQCVCIIGYHFEGSDCVQNGVPTATCGKNQVYQDGRCVCAQGFYLIGSACDVCPPYSAYNLNSLSCQCVSGYTLLNGNCVLPYTPPAPTPTPSVPTCSLNQRLLNNICVCLDGYYLIKGVCTYCAAPNYYDAQLAVCRPTCGTNQVLDINSLTCVCQSGFYSINGQCGGCQAYSIYNAKTKTCDCVQGYTLNSGNCIIQTRAPTPTPTLPVPSSPCGANMVFVDQQCICTKGYYLIAGSCQTCAAGTFFDVSLQICRIACQANQIYNKVNNTCSCAASFFLINGTCSQCPGNTTFDAKVNACSCPSGYTNKGGFCVVGCGVNEVLSNGQCCCITGFYPVNGICGQCEWNQVYDQGLGICRVPCDAKRIYNIASQSCVCLPQYYQMADGSCGTCPLHSTYSSVTQQCVCDQGYLSNLGLCTAACNPYEQFINGTCQCKQGYYLIGYSCGVCPPGQSYDATYRICRSPCKTNEVWDPTIRACRCLPGYYLVGGICSQCDSKTQVYNQKLQCCDCIDGYHKVSGQGCNGVCTAICNINEDWISGRCVCKPGYYLINNFCTQCPAGQIYDIYQRVCRPQCGTNQVYNFNSGKCDCAQGYYIVQGACSKCLAGETYDEYTQTCGIIPCQGLNEYYSDVTQQCVCLSQYVRIRGVCTNCSPGYYYDAYSDSCRCKPGFKEINGFCKSVCPSDQTYVNGVCQCNNGASLVNGKCVSANLCPLYSHLDVNSGCCVCNDGYSVINGKCSSYQYCGVNGYLKYGQCYCNDGYFWILGSCQPCGANQAYNGVVCECYVGYTRDVNGNCIKSNFIPNCYNNERYDSALQACVCVSGTVYLRGSCQTIPTCPQNGYFNGLQCVCNTNYILQNGQCVSANVIVPTCPANAYFNGVSCTCNSGYFQSDLNACAACATGTSWDGTKCASGSSCANGYTLNAVSGQCEPAGASCGANAAWNGATCVCSSGFNLINGQCQQCANGTTFDGSQCSSSSLVNSPSCGSNQIYVKGACVCNAGFYNIQGKCLACPANTQWNGKYCVCTNSDPSQWCLGQPYSTYSNGSCSCQSGYVSVNGICTASSS